MLTRFGQIAAGTRQSFNRTYDGLNKTTNSLLGDLGISRGGTNSANAVLGDLTEVEITTVAGAITDATTSISKNQTASAALDELHDKLGEMRQLVEDVALGDLKPKDVRLKDEEYQVLAGEVASLMEDTEYDGTKLLTGSTAVVQLNLDQITSMSLTDLSDDAMGTISIGMGEVTGSKAELDFETNAVVAAISDLEGHADDLKAFESRLDTAGGAMAVLELVTKQFFQDVFTSLSAQAKASSSTASKLLF